MLINKVEGKRNIQWAYKKTIPRIVAYRDFIHEEFEAYLLNSITRYVAHRYTHLPSTLKKRTSINQGTPLGFLRKERWNCYLPVFKARNQPLTHVHEGLYQSYDFQLFQTGAALLLNYV